MESSTVCGLPGPGPGPGPVPEPGPETSSAKAEPKQSPSPRDPIEEIYKAFPRKIGKDNALKAIGKAVDRLKVRGHTTRQAQEFLYKVTVAFAKSPAGNDGNFTPHPATWFNQGRYDDDQAEWLKQGGKLDRPTFETSSKVQYTDPENVYNGPAYPGRTQRSRCSMIQRESLGNLAVPDFERHLIGHCLDEASLYLEAAESLSAEDFCLTGTPDDLPHNSLRA